MTPNRRNIGLSALMLGAALSMGGGGGFPDFLDMDVGHPRGPEPMDPVPPVFPKDPQEAMDAAAEKRRLRAERKAENARRSAAGKNR